MKRRHLLGTILFLFGSTFVLLAIAKIASSRSQAAKAFNFADEVEARVSSLETKASDMESELSEVSDDVDNLKSRVGY